MSWALDYIFFESRFLFTRTHCGHHRGISSFDCILGKNKVVSCLVKIDATNSRFRKWRGVEIKSRKDYKFSWERKALWNSSTYGLQQIPPIEQSNWDIDTIRATLKFFYSDSCVWQWYYHTWDSLIVNCVVSVIQTTKNSTINEAKSSINSKACKWSKGNNAIFLARKISVDYNWTNPWLMSTAWS